MPYTRQVYIVELLPHDMEFVQRILLQYRKKKNKDPRWDQAAKRFCKRNRLVTDFIYDENVRRKVK